MKSVRIWNFSDPYFLAFGPNTGIYKVNCRIQFKYWKIRSWKIPNMDIFGAVGLSERKENETIYYNKGIKWNFS